MKKEENGNNVENETTTERKMAAGVEEKMTAENENTAERDKSEDNITADKKSKSKKNGKKVREKKKRVWNVRALKKGTYSATLSVIVVAIIIVLNLIVGQIPSKYTQFDISTGKLYTIGDKTKAVLDKLKEDITIYYVVESGNEDTQVEKLLNRYEEQSSKITVKKTDPVENPSFIQQYTSDQMTENSLIVVGANRNKIVDYSGMYETEVDYSTYQTQVTGFDGEGQITSAINYVISDSLPVVYYVQGHNEIDLPDQLVDRIQKANLELKELNLLTTDSIPEDAKGLLINSPQTDYSEEEAAKVLDYLKKGGKAVIVTDYTTENHNNVNSILAEYGIQVTNGIVIETNSNMYVQYPYCLAPKISASDITSGMTNGAANVLLTVSQGFKVAEDARDTLSIGTVLSPSSQAYAKMHPEQMQSYDKEDGDEDGPFILAATISEAVTDDADQTAEADKSTQENKTTQIVCYASSVILDATTNSQVSDGNYNLYMNGLTWLIGRDSDNLVSIASKAVEDDNLTITAASKAMVGTLTTVFLPVLCLVIGGIFCYTRKKR